MLNLYQMGDILIRIPKHLLGKIWDEHKFEHNFHAHLGIYLRDGLCVHVSPKKSRESNAVEIISLDEFINNEVVIVLSCNISRMGTLNVVRWIEKHLEKSYYYNLERNITSGKYPYENQMYTYCSHFVLNAFYEGAQVKLLNHEYLIDLRYHHHYITMWQEQIHTLMKVANTPNYNYTMENPLWCVPPLAFLKNLDFKFAHIKTDEQESDLVWR